jgi:hypothetical protein
MQSLSAKLIAGYFGAQKMPSVVPRGPAVTLEFRAEPFNVLNHEQFGQPGITGGFLSTGPGTPNQFSTITYSRNSPRILQVALKLYY